MEIPTREVLEDMLSIISSVIKRAVHSVLANLLRRDIKLFSKEFTQALPWRPHLGSPLMDRQTDRHVTHFLDLLEPIYNLTLVCVKPQQDFHLHPKSVSTIVRTGSSIFFKKKTQTHSEWLAKSRCGMSHGFLCPAVSNRLAGLSVLFQQQT